MRIIKAEHLGMCFGVRDAILLAQMQARTGPVTILGDLVHNEAVLSELKDNGIKIAQSPDALETSTVLITAHGASDKRMAEVKARGHTLLEATCPLVHLAHRAVRKLVANGYHPVIIGKRDHVEVRGLTEDLADFDVILSEAEVYELKEHARFGIAAQTTQPIDKVRHFLELIRKRFPRSEVLFADTVCQPTKQRQTAAIELARQCDVVIVIGGTRSNNTHELVKTCSRFCERVYHIQEAADLRPEWFDKARTVGITAGTSTPDGCIVAVEKWLAEIFQKAECEVRSAEWTGEIHKNEKH